MMPKRLPRTWRRLALLTVVASVAAVSHIPVEVYLRSTYEPDAEYVDGEIEERPMGEYDHAA